MQKILRADEITKIQVLGKGKRKRIEMIFSESEDSDLDKEQREPYSGSNFLYSESSSDDEEPLFQLSKVELCAKIKSLKRKLKDTMRENCRLRQSLVMLQVLPQAVTHFEELVGMAEALLKGGVTSSTSSLHSHAVWKASNNPIADSYAVMHSNSSSPITLNVEDEEQQTEKQFKIEKWQIALCNKSKPQKFINDLMQALYTHEYMATHSLTGAKSSSSKDKAAKPAMNQNEVQEIIGITKQLFPNTDDALIRRMMGQKLNNCTKKPILSKDLNSGAFQKHSFCGSTATSQGIISSAVPLSIQDQQDDDSLAANAQIQQSDSCLTLSPPTPQDRIQMKAGMKYDKDEHKRQLERLQAELEAEQLRSQELCRHFAAETRKLKEAAERDRQLLAKRLHSKWEQRQARELQRLRELNQRQREVEIRQLLRSKEAELHEAQEVLQQQRDDAIRQ
ncbi:PREDICTED: BEN domain-containing protein 6, partial [Haliaeetus leucocephalus]